MDKTTVAGGAIVGGLLLASAFVSPAHEYVLITEDGERAFPTQQAAEAAAHQWVDKKDDEAAKKEKVFEMSTKNGALRAIVEKRPKAESNE